MSDMPDEAAKAAEAEATGEHEVLGAGEHDGAEAEGAAEEHEGEGAGEPE